MKRNTWILIALLVILVIFTLLVLQQPGEYSTTGSTGRKLVDYDSAAVNKMEIFSSNGHVVLEKDGDTWNLTSPIKYRVTEYMATHALGSGRNIELKSLVSSNPSKQDLFQVDSSGTLVKFYEKGTEKAAVRLGKATTSFTETYVRAEGSDDVYIADGMLASVYDRKPKEWRDKAIYHTSKESITDVRLHYGDTTVTVMFKDSLWTVDGDSIGEPTSFLAALSKFDTEDFIDTTLANLPMLSASIEVNGAVLNFYFTRDTNKYYVQNSQSPQWFSVPLWKAKQVLKRKDDFFVKPRTPVPPKNKGV